MTRKIVWFHLMALSLCIVSDSHAQKKNPFRWRPKHSRILHEEGVLETYRIGNHNLTLSIRLSNGKHDIFDLRAPAFIDGRNWDCDFPPNRGIALDTNDCKEWPAYLKLGSSKVRVSYWFEVRDGVNRKQSDEVVVLQNRQK